MNKITHNNPKCACAQNQSFKIYAGKTDRTHRIEKSTS